MTNHKEIDALLFLMDDPDEDVYANVFDRLCYWGSEIIPNLENLWENTEKSEVQDRIEMLIHNLQFKELYKEFEEWLHTGQNDLLEGAILVAKFCYPEIKKEHIRQEIKKINRSIWLELNDYLTPLEQFHILNSMLYHFFKLRGLPFKHDNPNDFLINKVIECKSGNALSNGIFIHIIAEILGIPIYAIDVPQHFLLGFFRKEVQLLPAKNNQAKIGSLLFFIDASSGQMFSHDDMIGYFQKAGIVITSKMCKPLHSKKIIFKLLFQLSKCYKNEAEKYKMEELQSIMGLF